MKYFDDDPRGLLDAATERPRPCCRRTWCIREEHANNEPCHEVPRVAIEQTDFGPEASKRRRY